VTRKESVRERERERERKKRETSSRRASRFFALLEWPLFALVSRFYKVAWILARRHRAIDSLDDVRVYTHTYTRGPGLSGTIWISHELREASKARARPARDIYRQESCFSDTLSFYRAHPRVPTNNSPRLLSHSPPPALSRGDKVFFDRLYTPRRYLVYQAGLPLRLPNYRDNR